MVAKILSCHLSTYRRSKSRALALVIIVDSSSLGADVLGRCWPKAAAVCFHPCSQMMHSSSIRLSAKLRSHSASALRAVLSPRQRKLFVIVEPLHKVGADKWQYKLRQELGS